MKQRTHQVVVNITFNKKVTRSAAVRAARDGIHGKLFASIYDEVRDGWETARIGAIKSAKAS